MLISAVMPIMSIYRLPHGQYGYSGHVVNLPQDVVSFATSLPRLPSELDILVIRKENDQSHRDFSVRRSVIEEALTWLLQNNIYYQANQIHVNQDALAQLPQDGTLSTLTSFQPDPLSTEQQATASVEDEYEAHLSESFVPSAVRPITEQETVCQSVLDRQGHSNSPSLMWPTIGGTPPSMNSQRRGTFPWLFLHYFLLVLLTFLDLDAIKSQLAITLNIYRCLRMTALQTILVFASLPSTLRCGGVHSKQVESTSANIQEMPSYQWKSSVTW